MKVFSELHQENSRPSNLFKLQNEIAKSGVFDKLIDTHYTADGIASLFRSKDGNAYEVIIRPAEYSKEFKHYTKK